MFALDHIHYSRWLPVHIRDTMAFFEKYPDIVAEFLAGKFVIHKTSNKFSAMACHEQNNTTVKESGGAIGLTTDPLALRHWMVAAPEVVRIVGEFEEYVNITQEDAKHLHHEQYCSVQQKFQKDVNSLIAVFEEFGIHFLRKNKSLIQEILWIILLEKQSRKLNQLVRISTKFSLKNDLRNVKNPSQSQLSKISLFSKTTVKHPARQQNQITALKNDCNLSSRLYISCQTRDRDLDTFFAHHHCHWKEKLDLVQSQISSIVLNCVRSNCYKHLMLMP